MKMDQARNPQYSVEVFSLQSDVAEGLILRQLSITQISWLSS